MVSEQTPFRTFIDLVAFDQGLRALNEQIEQLEQAKQEFQDQQDALEAERVQAKDRINQLRKEVDMHELRMKELDIQLKDKKTRLDGVTNTKEYQSINTEINIIKSEQHNLENTLVDAWNKLETAQRSYEKLEKDHDKKLESIRALQQETEDKIVLFQQELESKEQERSDKEKVVPDEWLEKYAMMRMRVADPVVPVLNGSCSACFYTITEQDMQQLRRNKLLQCRECYRFLYIEQKEDNTEKKEAASESTI